MKLEDIVAALELLEDSAVSEGVSHHFIEISSSNDEITLSANQPGLIWLALQSAKLALDSSNAKHVHIDTAGIADTADGPLVISFKKAEWE